MKVFWLIWTLYVLLLSGIPCELQCHRLSGPPATAADSRHADDDCHSDEVCSPFCRCATCPGFSVPQPLVAPQTEPVVAFLPPPTVFVYQAPAVGERDSRIWQPPRRA